MANTKSAKKEMRKNARRRVHNSAQRARLRTYDKRVRNLVADGKVEEAQTVLRAFVSFLDRAGKRNLIHQKQADRRKARIAALINKSTAKSA